MKTNWTKSIGTWTFNVRGSLFNLVPALLLLVAATSSSLAATRYVWQGSPSPGPPYTNWATAAHLIQDAVDAAVAGDEVVVTNGVYATGGRAVYGTMTNRVAVDKPLTLRSVNGPEVTIIVGAKAPGGGCGDGAIRCAYLTNDTMLSGFTLTNGATRNEGGSYKERSGGGVWCESVSSAVTNCQITGNSAPTDGGGALSGTLNNCTLTGNSARIGGGAAMFCFSRKRRFWIEPYALMPDKKGTVI